MKCTYCGEFIHWDNKSKAWTHDTDLGVFCDPFGHCFDSIATPEDLEPTAWSDFDPNAAREATK